VPRPEHGDCRGYSDLGRQATNPQWQYPTVYNPKVNYTWTAGAHSFKTGYEFQRINTQVQDVNPLYGRDTYNGQFTRPAGAAANNLYNLADFMLGLRAQYALSNVLVADLRRNMHFAYIQDDWRATSKLTLNLGMRYEYATPMWEADNVLSNFDPSTNSMILAKNGSLYHRALVNPDRNNFGPRLGFAYTLAPKTVVRGGYGISYVHFNRAGAGDLLSINGPQVINAVVKPDGPGRAHVRAGRPGLTRGACGSVAFNPLTANITYMPTDYHSSPVQSWYISVQREIAANMLVDLAYVGNRADDLQAKFEWRMRGDLTLLSSLTLSRTKDNGAQSLENSNGNFPAPQDFRNLAADYGRSNYDQPYNSTTSFVWACRSGKDGGGQPSRLR